MEYIKKNWVKLIFAIIALVGLFFTAMLLVKGPIKDLSLGEYANDMFNSAVFMLIAQLLFFASIFLYSLLKMFDKTKKISTYVLLGLSIGALVLAILSITTAIPYSNHASDQIESGLTLAEMLPSNVPIPDIGNITREAFINKLQVSRYALTIGTYTKIINLIIFAIFPLVFAVKNFFKKSK